MAQAFRRALDLRLRRCHGVVVFICAMQVRRRSRFISASKFQENIHPPVTVWIYSRAYDWGIDLARARLGEPCIVKPIDMTVAIGARQ